MPGTREGGLKARDKNLAKDPDFYKKIALKAQESWERNGRKPRGFAADRELASLAGQKGGYISRRGPTKNGRATQTVPPHYAPGTA